MQALTLSFTIALSFISLAQGAAINKPVLFTDGLAPHVDASLLRNLPNTSYTSDVWEWGWTPQSCMDAANAHNLSPYDFDIWNAHYSDCSTPWVFCQHHMASLTMEDLFSYFGRLPVHERQWVRHIIALPGGGSAYMSNADIVLMGPVKSMSVFQHEVGHAVDMYKNGKQSSLTSNWTNAISQDSCVADDYSKTSAVEAYTQVSILCLYEIVNPGGLDPGIGPQWRCLQNQKDEVDGFQRDAMWPGGSCDRRWRDADIVSMGPATGNRKRSRVWPVVDDTLPVPPPGKVEEHDLLHLVF
ncbi:hypothetical protein EXIGLDRAFT_722096 [Exidia glandulosa HHB12029]|uniref:Zincin n=1 Tax=Exidia glandulosa HHB12029 TaxID=1314781 RepID=A0A165FFS0_EXIGL|nr:hypothetical protein EXIGLDRAFT_722096 [Exidia glandulosa HHB12029]